MRRASAVLAWCLLVAGPGAAGAEAWTSNGPHGGSFRSVVTSPPRPARHFARADSGRVYRSDDAAASWVELPGAPAYRVVPDAMDPDVVHGPGLRSTDAGATWSGPGPHDLALGFNTLMDFAVDPGRPATQYVALGAYWLHSVTGGIVRTTDGGTTWSAVRSGPAHTSLLLDPSDPSRLLATTESFTLLRSTTEVIRSTDGGTTWSTVLPAPSAGTLRVLAADRRRPATLYAGGAAGLYRSGDRGDSWERIVDGEIRSISVDPATGTVYVGTSSGLLKGPPFLPTGLGGDLPLPEGVRAISVSPSGLLFAAAFPYGIVRSSDGGATFAPAGKGLAELGVSTLALAPDTLYAGAGFVHRSDDEGGTWRLLARGPGSSAPLAMAADPARPGTAYAAAGGVVHRTTDGGTSWTPVLSGLTSVSRLVVDPRAPSTLHALAKELWRSDDGGTTWTSRSIPSTPTATDRVLSLAFGSGPVLYAGLNGRGVFRSTDGGSTWSPAGAGLPEDATVSALLVDRGAPATILAAAPYGDADGLYRSSDGGDTWAPFGALRLGRGHRVRVLVQEPGRPRVLHAGTTSGLFRSSDGGSSWRALDEGLGPVAIEDLVFDPATSTLHVATARGVFERRQANPPPALTSLDPAEDRRGNGAFTLRALGSGFVPESVVLWNGTPRPTAFVSETLLEASIDAGDIASAGVASVSVRSPEPGGGTSSTLPFTILDHLPTPSISRLSPDSIASSAPAFELHVTGAAFTFRSRVTWNGAPRPTRLQSPTELVASIGADDVSVPGAVAVAVTTPGGGTTGELAFVVTSHTLSRLVPIVLDVAGRNGARFTSELTLVNRGGSPAALELTYTPAADLGATGGGTVTETLPAKRQTLVPDALEHLRALGLAIPREGAQGGTLALVFRGLAGPDVGYAAVRVTSTSGSGKTGVAMPALGPDDLLADAGFVFGLRDDAGSRSNLALVNAGRTEPVTLRVTLVRDDGRQVTALAPLTLAPGEWRQLTSPLAHAGHAAGWARIERVLGVSGPGPFFAYGVVNDAVTNDGSVIPAAGEVPSDSTVPVVVRSDRYESELVLGNPGDTPIEATLSARPPAVPVTVTLAPREQKVIPRALDLLLGAPPPTGFASGLRVTGRGPAGPVAGVFAAARTTTIGADGAYGVFTPAAATPATRDAWVYGLRNDGGTRSNLAVGSAVDVRLSVELYSGETGERVETLGPLVLPGNAPEWRQIDSPLAALPIAHGWARVVNDSPAGTFYAYGVLNDNGTGDGSYLPMATSGP